MGLFRKRQSKRDQAAAMLELVRRGWRDIERAKDVMAMVELLFHAFVFPLGSSNREWLAWFELLPPKQRAIFVALSVAGFKPAIEELGRDACRSLGRAAREYADQCHERQFFDQTLDAALGSDRRMSSTHT